MVQLFDLTLLLRSIISLSELHSSLWTSAASLYRGVTGSSHTHSVPATCAPRASAQCCSRSCACPDFQHMPCMFCVFSAALQAPGTASSLYSLRPVLHLTCRIHQAEMCRADHVAPKRARGALSGVPAKQFSQLAAAPGLIGRKVGGNGPFVMLQITSSPCLNAAGHCCCLAVLQARGWYSPGQRWRPLWVGRLGRRASGFILEVGRIEVHGDDAVALVALQIHAAALAALWALGQLGRDCLYQRKYTACLDQAGESKSCRSQKLLPAHSKARL